ncbi:MAG: YbbR-like domain-containing protein [Bacillota bacterium]
MMQRWEHLFRRDFWLKVLAVALSILLWAMVVEDYNKETTVPFDVPLKVTHHPTFELFEGRHDLETTVEVSVSGPSLLVNGLKVDEIEALVDYRQVTEPNRAQDVPVQVKMPARVRDQVKYRVTPSTVSVTLVQTRTAHVPITVTPDAGVIAVGAREFRYTASSVEKQIEMRGRTDYLNLVRAATIALDRADLEPPLEAGVLKEKTRVVSKPVQPVDATAQPVEKLQKYYADVAITWEELPPGRRVQVHPRTQGTLPTGFELVSVAVDPDYITLRSASVTGSMPEVTVVETEPVDLTGQSKSFTTTARILAPPGTSPAVTSVGVIVTIAETKMEKIFGALPVVIRGQPVGYDVEMPTPTVQVRLTGPYTLMQPLDASAVEVYVDLQGLTEGRHRVPVKVTYPPGVPEVAVDPAIIEILIMNR